MHIVWDFLYGAIVWVSRLAQRLARHVRQNRAEYTTRAKAASARAIALFVSACLLASFSLFGSEEALWSFSRDLFYRISASFYPSPKDRAATVVLLNDASFRAFDTYPVRYGTHADNLRALQSYAPRAVFIDFAFIDERPDSTIDDLKKVIEEFYDSRIKIYVPTYKRSEADPGIRADLWELANRGRIQLVSFELGRSLWGTPLYSLYSPSERRFTASASIIQDLAPDLFDSIKTIKEFEIWWGLPPARINCIRNRDSCGWIYGFWGRMFATMNLKILPFNLHFGSESVDLPYSPVVYVSEVRDGNKRGMIERSLNGKIIFYGSDLDVLRDNYFNPVYSYRSRDRMLPGIFFHAMALENMFDLGHRIKIPRGENLQSLWLRDVLSIGIICIAVFVCGLFLRARSHAWEVFAIVLTSVGIATVEFFGLNFAPSNWIGVFTFVTAAHLVRADEGLQKLVGFLASVRRTSG